VVQALSKHVDTCDCWF